MLGKELKAVIWDMDGVLVDTYELHFQAWREIYTRFAKTPHPHPLTRNQFESVFGMLNDDTVIKLFGPDLASTSFIETVSTEKEVLFRKMIHGRIKPIPGVLSWLTYFHNTGYKQAVASSAPELNIDSILSELKLYPHFDVILSGEESPHLASKPAPDIFLEAARRLKVHPARCLVIEDSVVGVQAAKASSMVCLAVTTTHLSSELTAADWTIDSFRDLMPQTILRMWERQTK